MVNSTPFLVDYVTNGISRRRRPLWFNLFLLFVVALSFNTAHAQQYTANFSTQPTIDKYGFPADWPWNPTVTVTLGGVDYLITDAINDSFVWTGSAIRLQPASTVSLHIKRKDGGAFKFYGVKLQYTNYRSAGFYEYPFLRAQYATTGAAQADELYDADQTVTLSKANGVAVTGQGVTLTFSGLNTLYLDDLIVGPASSAVAPTVTTASANVNSATSATLGGNVTADGGATVTERGIVYVAGSGTPTTSNTKVVIGNGPGSFSQQVTNLTLGMTYTARAYAINSIGTSYGNNVSFTTNTTVTSIIPNGTSPANTGSVQFTVTFASSVAGITTSNFATSPSSGITGSSIASVSGSGTTYTVTVNTGSGNGTLGLTLANDTGITPSIYNEPFTGTSVYTIDKTAPAAPVVTIPANGSFVSTTTPTYVGVAEASSTVTVIIDGSSIGTTTANGSGNWSLTQPTALAQGSHTVRSTAADAVGNVSPSSNTNNFTVDSVRPSVTITSSAGMNGGATGTTPIPFTITFSEVVSGFSLGDLTVTGGTPSGLSGTGTTYTFNVTPTSSGNAVTVNVAANIAQDVAGNGNTAAAQFSITYQQPAVTVISVTRLTPSPTATTSVSYRVVFSGAVSGLSTSNFNLTTSGLSGAGISSLSGSNTTYTVVVNTGSGDGTLRLDVANATGVSPTVSNVPYTSGETYTITKTFAAAPTLRIQAAGSNSGNGDVTAFLDLVQVLQSGTSTVVTNGLQNASFENNNVEQRGFKKTADGVVASPWLFTGLAGVSRNGSAFGSTAADGDAVGLVQSAGDNNASLSQSLAVPTGSYQVRFRAIQRNYTSLDQRLNVFVNNVFVGSIQPNNIPTYDTFTSAVFNVAAPALTATVSTNSASPTSTTPIPFAVTFSQSVGSSFTASDVTVAGGTLASGSFSGSGAGPYTFTVTPSSIGTVTVSLAANVANDVNNTGNSASNAVSVQFQSPTITLAPNSLPNGQQGTAYSQALTTSGGTVPYAYAITAGALPAGLILNLSTGTISGTPMVNGSFTFTVTARDNSPAPGPYSGSRAYTLTINPQPVTAAPVVTTPANGSLTNNRQPTYAGTAPANSTVTVYVGPSAGTASAIGTTTADASGNFSLVQPTTLTDGVYQVYATAQTNGSTVSANSNTNSFTVDTTVPTVTLSSATVPNGGSTSTSPVLFTATFSEPVTGLTSTSFSVSGGRVSSGPTAGSGNTYTFQVTPNGSGTVSVQVLANAVQDQAGNNNAISSPYTFTFQAPTIALTPASLPNGTQVTAYSLVFTASGGTSPYTYAITAGALPAGLTLASNGTLSGTPAANGSFTFTVTATDASTTPGPYSGSRTYTFTINPQPVTAAPVVTTPANGSFLNTAIPTYSGTAPANSTVTIYVDNTSIGTTIASGTGNWSLVSPTALTQGNHKVRATAQLSGQAVSASSNENSFTVDTVAPTVVITSSAGVSGSTTGTSPVPFTVTFSEAVTGFVAADLSVSGGSVADFAGSGTSYTFDVTPTADGLITVDVPANVAQDGANNGNVASTFSITYSRPVTATPIVMTPANGSVITVTKPTYTGTATALASLTLVVDGNTATSQTTTVDGSGNWTLTQLTDLAPGTHTVQVRAQLAGQAASAYSAVTTFTVVVLPTVVTATPTGVSSSGATLGGEVTNAGAGTVSERGVVYVAGNGAPTTSDTKVIIGAGTGSFAQAITNLTASTTYSVRAYAVNQAGTSYGPTQVVSTSNALAISSVIPSAVCAGGTITVAYTNSSPGTPLQVYLNGPSTSNRLLATLNASQASGTITAAIPADRVAGQYSVYLSGSGATSGSVNVTVNALPVATLTNDGPLSCTKPAVTLTAGGAAGVPGTTYRFSSGAGQVGSSNIATVSTSGTYSVTVTDGNGCSATTETSVTSDQSSPQAALTNDGPLTCAKTTVTLTATGNGSYRFSPGATQTGISNQATVSTSGVYSVTVTATNGCSATAQTTVEVNTTVAAPVLTTSALSTENTPISVTASGCSGTINWTATGGTGTASGSVYTFTQIGNYTLTATCTVGACTSPAAPLLTLQIRPGGFAISGVDLVRCQLVDAGRGQYEISLNPQYSGLTGSPVSFGITNELAATTAPGPYTVRLYTDNATITLAATQANAQATYRYNWLAACNSTQPAPNRPPVAQPIPNQVLVVGQPYQLELTTYFVDPDGQPLTFTATGLPAGLQLSGSRISGSPAQAGTSTVQVTALDPAGAQVVGSVVLQVNPAPTTPTPGLFSIAGVTGVRCETLSAGERQLSFSPVYTGLTGAPVSFGITNELAATTAPGPYSLRLYTDNPTITLTATQGGTSASYRYDWLASCATNPTTPPAANRPPVVGAGLANQTAQVGQGFTLFIAAGTFTDPDNDQLRISVSGLPAGLSFSTAQHAITGTPAQAGSSTIQVTATDPGGLSTSTSFVLTVLPAATTPTPGNFSIAGVTDVRCETLSVGERRLSFSPVYTGLTGAPVSFGITNELATTTAPGPYSLRLYTDNPVINLQAVQGGTQASYRFEWLAACATSRNGRQAVTEAATQLSVVVLGNPVVGESVDIIVRGVDGQAVELSLTDLAGNRLYQQSIPQASGDDRVTLPVSTRQAITILKVSTATQYQTVKLIRR